MSLPRGFTDLISGYGAPCLEGLFCVLEGTAPEVSIRLNRAKGIQPCPGCDIVPWWPDGIYLDERPQFTFDPALHQGLYYVQDASSMAVGRVVEAVANLIGNTPIVYLDACAAPGGKSLAALDALPLGSIVVSNEYDYRRASVLAENIAKWGNPNSIVTRGDTQKISELRDCFDIIAADVPCSGEGMMRKDADAVSQWSPSLVSECAKLQREIINNLWPALRPGGYMIYSTCTFNRNEDEENVEYICRELGASTVDIGLDSFAGVAKGIKTDEHCYRFIPGLIRGEGLFIAVIRKDGNGQRLLPKPPKKGKNVFSKAPTEAADTHLWLNGAFETFLWDDKIIALPENILNLFKSIVHRLDVVSAGVAMATLKGRDLIPEQALALSTAFNREAFPSVEVDYTTALAYLRSESLNVDLPYRGHVLLTYKGMPLGFIKNLGNRSNNLYPRQWRILSQNAPAEPPSTPFNAI